MVVPSQIYKCEHCGIIAEILHAGSGALICCGEAMTLIEAKTSAQEVNEKHTPVKENASEGCIIKVGSIPHPMEEKHYIEWIEIKTKNGVFKKYLKAGDKPEIVCSCECEPILLRAYCNIHGLWEASLS